MYTQLNYASTPYRTVISADIIIGSSYTSEQCVYKNLSKLFFFLKKCVARNEESVLSQWAQFLSGSQMDYGTERNLLLFFYQQKIIIPDKLATKTLMCDGSWILRKRSIYVPIGKFEGFFWLYPQYPDITTMWSYI